ncbi:carbohydrate ABC transporter permease [uncultured Sphaerochaeta sp.]|uniref:carbohydrate ABC transporter permease n=1 Tax=uncultured Sphaerochaeta sp. TaxID=886478 RepID=UPI002A0A16A8|nr:carbohydrate ABC transporter permease [uncultured Sphaerochaeta sp.]
MHDKATFTQQKQWKTSDIVILVVTLILALLFFFPVFFSLISAFKTNGEILKDPIGIPKKLNFSNFAYLWNKTSIPQAALNSLILTVTSCIFMIALIPMSSYVIERRGGKFKAFFYAFFISGMMIPFQAYMIPLFKELRFFGLFGTMLAPILIYIAGATSFGTLLYCSFIQGIPKEIEESASIDGCSPFSTFWRIVFPLLKPCTASMLILQGVGIWNDFLMPMMVMPANHPKTINVEIFSFIGEFQVRYDVLFSGTFVAIVPVIIVFIVLQKYFVNGIMSGAVKS